MVGMTVNKKKLDALINNLTGFANSLNYRKPLTRSVEVLRYEQQTNFKQQGRKYGTWKKLSDKTKKQRKKLGFPPARPILRRTGNLERGFRAYVLNDKLAKTSNVVPYAIYHQEGTAYMPQRRIMGITRNSRKAIGLIFSQFIAGQIRQYFYKR